MSEKIEANPVPSDRPSTARNWVKLWGVPFAPFTFQETLDYIDQLIQQGQPSYFVTANLHTVMLANQNPAMMEAMEKATFNLADGMPMVWVTKRSKHRIPERVAGSDLIPALCKIAAQKQYGIYLLGGAPGIGEQAAANLRAQYPGLEIVGIEAPFLSKLTEQEELDLIFKIRGKKPHMLFVAFGQPKGEIWLYKNCEKLGVPVCAQIGATLDFIAGKVPRAPSWMQMTGLEWAFRLYQEPNRLILRYSQNSLFLIRKLIFGPRPTGC